MMVVYVQLHSTTQTSSSQGRKVGGHKTPQGFISHPIRGVVLFDVGVQWLPTFFFFFLKVAVALLKHGIVPYLKKKNNALSCNSELSGLHLHPVKVCCLLLVKTSCCWWFDHSRVGGDVIYLSIGIHSIH